MKTLTRLTLFLTLFAASATHAQQAPPEAAKTPDAKAEDAAPKPRNTKGARKFESTITAIEKVAGGTKITLQTGSLSLMVKPTTLVFRDERGIGASDLQSGDSLSLIALRGARSKISIKENASVVNTAPLTLKIGELATMTLSKADAWEFNRSTKMDATALAVGQTIAVELGLQRDGDISPNRVAIIVAKPKVPRVKKPRATKPRIAKPRTKKSSVAPVAKDEVKTETANAE